MTVAENLLARVMRQLVDPAYGIANRLIELGASPYAPDVFVACADGGPAAYLTDNKPAAWHNCSSASGAAYQREQACWATLGELAERYCASICDRNALLRCSGRELNGRAVPVFEMILFARAQYDVSGFPFKRFDVADTHDWVEGFDMMSERRVFAPAQLLFLSQEWKDEQLMQTVSTGLACHRDPEAARLSALLELIERDGFAAAWLLGMPLPHLELTVSDKLQLSPQTLSVLQQGALDVRLYAISNAFGVANIVAAAEHKECGFGVVGAAANICPFKAIDKAVLELSLIHI